VANDKNKLYYGDNLEVLQRYVKDESVDLVYLDPPFNSRQDYNVLFAEKDGSQSSSQIHAFEDTWEWNIDAERAYELIVEQGGRVADALRAFRTFLGGSDMMAYLAMMAPRLVELRRVLKETGSIYLHCDPTASHYLKILMDAVLGGENFADEIIWRRTTTKNDYKQGAVNWPRVHDTLLMYHRSTAAARQAKRFKQPFSPYDESYLNTFYTFNDPDGRRYRLSDLSAPGQGSRGHPEYEFLGVMRYWRYNKEKMQKLYDEGKIEFRPTGKVPFKKTYLDEMPGVAIGDVWTDVRGMINLSNEMLGYPTQKPEALLERIIEASSNEGDVVLDPFCGCGTAISAAQKLNRRWIGIDITHLAVNLIKTRLSDAFGPEIKTTYEVVGEPTDYEGAAALAAEDKFQFQSWALGLVGARPAGPTRKGADKGIDGRKTFHDDNSGVSKDIIFSVKGGGVTDSQLRDLEGVLVHEKAEIGVFLSFEEPTRPMKKRAAEAGLYKSSDGTTYPRLQILTIQQMLDGKQPEYPLHRRDATFKKAPRSRPAAAENLNLPLLPGEN
jgi:DNA modification methylase